MGGVFEKFLILFAIIMLSIFGLLIIVLSVGLLLDAFGVNLPIKAIANKAKRRTEFWKFVSGILASVIAAYIIYKLGIN